MSKMGSRTAGRRARRQFSEEFRIGAVRLILDEGKTVGAVARELDLTPSALAQWVKQARADRTKGKAGLTTEERAELARLPQPDPRGICHEIVDVVGPSKPRSQSDQLPDVHR